jgi:tRNA threonylcarbamoyladenosine biosynthesis protein TsaB
LILLLTDTSGKNGSVALARATESSKPEGVQVIDSVPLVGGTFSAQLVPQIADLLKKHNLRRGDIDGFVVVSGPGSFTGLRVGLAAIKALAEILRKPIVPLSLLEVVALAAGKQGRVVAALDAGRAEVYAGEYDVAGDARLVHARPIQEKLVRKDDLAQFRQASVISTPDPILAATLRESGLSVFQVEAVTPAMIAARGWKKLHDGEAVSPEQLDANYIRRGAELASSQG